jgi:hypothetical protein
MYTGLSYRGIIVNADTRAVIVRHVDESRLYELALHESRQNNCVVEAYIACRWCNTNSEQALFEPFCSQKCLDTYNFSRSIIENKP